jgi:hypothetical protein
MSIEYSPKYSLRGTRVSPNVYYTASVVNERFLTRRKDVSKLIRKNNLVHWVLVAAYFIAAVIAVIPRGAASKESLLGYRALCSFAPISTAICISMIALHVILAVKSKGGIR